MKVAFHLFETIHSKKDAASSRIRGRWLIKYWPEAEEFINGQKYDAVIFQKVYLTEYAKLFDGIKILDICDPDMYVGNDIRQMVEDLDAIVVSTPALQEVLLQTTNKPVIVIPDRHDLEYFKEKKFHKGKAKEVVWFGYSHNAGSLKQIKYSLERFGLNLSIISENPVSIINEDDKGKWNERWTKWSLEKVNTEIIKSDIVIMPLSLNPMHRFKSNNKIIHSWLLRMPVAFSAEDLERFLSAEEREREAEKNYQEAVKNWDVRISVQEYKDLIERIRNDKKNI